MDKETRLIIESYTQKQMSLREIAALINRDHHYVARRLKSNQIEVMKRNKPLKTKVIQERHMYPGTCEVCQKDFDSGNRKQRFCSHKCRGEAKRLKLFTRIDSISEIRECPFCGEEFSCRAKSIQKYCTRRCFDLQHSKRMAGENNPSYINGSSYNKRSFRGEDWNIIRQRIYVRDNYTCQNCKVKCVGRDRATRETYHLIIQCHHIKHYENPEDNHDSNLITLCVSCHGKAHGELNQ